MNFRLTSILILLTSLAGGCSGDDSTTASFEPAPTVTTTEERGDHAFGGYTRAYDRGTGMGEDMQNAVDQQNSAMEEQLR